MLGEIGCHPEISFYKVVLKSNLAKHFKFNNIRPCHIRYLKVDSMRDCNQYVSLVFYVRVTKLKS